MVDESELGRLGLSGEGDVAEVMGHRVKVVGLMVLPPYEEDPERTRPLFRRLRSLRDRARQEGLIDGAELSMGMSHDLEVAVEEGATLVRVGTAIFGERH